MKNTPSYKNGFEDLSNFAKRPFTIDIETSDSIKKKTFHSVEQAFHYLKAKFVGREDIAEKSFKNY